MKPSGQSKTSPCRDGEELEESSSNLTLPTLGLEQEGNYSCASPSVGRVRLLLLSQRSGWSRRATIPAPH